METSTRLRFLLPIFSKFDWNLPDAWMEACWVKWFKSRPVIQRACQQAVSYRGTSACQSIMRSLGQFRLQRLTQMDSTLCQSIPTRINPPDFSPPSSGFLSNTHFLSPPIALAPSFPSLSCLLRRLSLPPPQSLSGRIQSLYPPASQLASLCFYLTPSIAPSPSPLFSLPEERCCGVSACHSSWAFPHLFTTSPDKGAGVCSSLLPSAMRVCVHM